MATSSTSASLGADGMGGGLGGSGKDKASGDDAILVAALAAAESLVPATLLPEAMFKERREAVFRVFNARSSQDKATLEANMILYFSVHGTSPRTAWATYEFDLVSNGVTVPAATVVGIIGSTSLKKFMGRYSSTAMKLYSKSPALRAALASRVASAGLEGDEGVYVIDFVGKDGGLDPQSMRIRNRARTLLVNNRNEDRVQHAKDGATEMAVAREVRARDPASSSVDPFA